MNLRNILLSILVLIFFQGYVDAKEVLELSSSNFELSITAYRYIALLFYDSSIQGEQLVGTWEELSKSLPSDFPDDSEIAMINGEDPHLNEIVQQYHLTLPCIKVVRRGILTDYRGPLTNTTSISAFVSEDAQPSVQLISNSLELANALVEEERSVVLGLFSEDQIMEFLDEKDLEFDSWDQFQNAADYLRGHIDFYVITDINLIKEFNLKTSDLPQVFLISNQASNGLIQYQGEILEISLCEWILKNSRPIFGELTFSSVLGELFASQFFSSKILNFILILPENNQETIDSWKQISQMFKDQAIFAYFSQISYLDIVNFFDLNASQDFPIIVSYNPLDGSKYKSKPNIDVYDTLSIISFVQGVIEGKNSKLLNSEPVPKVQSNSYTKIVASNMLRIINSPEKDVMLIVTNSVDPLCKSLRPTFELIGRAVQNEPRIQIALIDAHLNDLPEQWKIQSYPRVLWFPAKNKPYPQEEFPQPINYWDSTGLKLLEVVAFIKKETSFDPKSLLIATVDQVHVLLSDEEALHELYAKEEINLKRNEGREIFSNKFIDWAMGEIVFDGKRIHYGILVLFSLSLLLNFYFLVLSASTSTKRKLN